MQTNGWASLKSTTNNLFSNIYQVTLHQYFYFEIHLNQGGNKAKDPLEFTLNGNHDEMTVQRHNSVQVA